MSPVFLIVALLVAFALRLGYLAYHFHYLDALWSDYERRGLKYRLAQWLDWLTLGGFSLPALYAFYNITSLPTPLVTTFVGCLGIQLLSRLRIHCFPRTNVPGGLTEAKINLFVHGLMSFVAALVLTLVAAIYLWWRQG